MKYAFPPERWLSEISSMDAGHVHFRAKVVPEGALFVAHCTRCNGHYETVTDLRGIEMDMHTAVEETERLMPMIAEFQETHANCDVNPLAHAIPTGVMDIVTIALKGAGKIVGEGKAPVLPMLAIRLADPELPVMAVPVPIEGDFGTAERVQGVAHAHYAIREYVREHELDIMGAVFWTEAWVAAGKGDGNDHTRRPADQPDRREAIFLVVMTKDHVRVGTAPIERASGIQDVGHGSLGPIEWMKEGARYEGIMIEGVMAV